MSLQLDENRPAPPPKSSLLPRGCWIALAIFLALTVLSVVGLAIAAYIISQDPDVQRVARVVGGSFRIAQQAQNAPGAREVRALGCDQAMVIGAEQFAELARELDDQFPEPQGEREGLIVLCQQVTSRPPPSCEQIAQVYVAAVPNQDAELTVLVQTSTQQGQCSARFDQSGQMLERFQGRPSSTSTQPPSSTPNLTPLPLQPSPFDEVQTH